MYSKGTTMALLLLISTIGFAQHPQANADSPGKHDSLAVIMHKYGAFEGHFRSYTMFTINHNHYPDYFAQGVGGGLAYHSPVIRRFQIGVSGFIIYNVHASPLAENKYASRYEMGLFDLTDPDNHEDLDRLENLYLRYYLTSRRQTSFIQLGKFQLNTPLMNMQDSRMRPNLLEGIWSEVTIGKSLTLKGGWVWDTSPRSTIRWYGIGESVGIYGNGRAVDGSPAKYYSHVHSNGVGIANITWAPANDFSYHVWDYYADNLFNLVLHKAEFKKKLNSATTLFAGGQHLWQHSVSPDGIEVASQYIGPKEKSHVVSLRLGVSLSSKTTWSVNYTRITAHGRFLFPREWGTETLYTYISRERNEGSGDVHAWMTEHTRLFGKTNNLSLQTLAGIYKMPAVDNYKLNKYAIPSYYHLAIKTRYTFHGFLQGLEAQALYVYKGMLERDQLSEIHAHNKVMMHHGALVFDYFF